MRWWEDLNDNEVEHIRSMTKKFSMKAWVKARAASRVHKFKCRVCRNIYRKLHNHPNFPVDTE